MRNRVLLLFIFAGFIAVLIGCTTVKLETPDGLKAKYSYSMFQEKAWRMEKVGDDYKVQFGSTSDPLVEAWKALAVVGGPVP